MPVHIYIIVLWCWLCATVLSAGSSRSNNPAYDGRGNNLKHPAWGSAGTPFTRFPIKTTDYACAVVEMAGTDRPEPREISLALMSSPYLKALNEKRTSKILTAVGQYAAVDITNRRSMPAVSSESRGPATAPIQVPLGDAFMSRFTENGTASTTGSRAVLKFGRSHYVRDAAGVRQQINFVSHFLDASAVYGESEEKARQLRLGSAGLLKDDGSRGLPLNVETRAAVAAAATPLVNVSNDADVESKERLRAAGFLAVNQHPALLVMATLWLREHNRRALEAATINPHVGDEEAFQYARKWVIAHLQHTVYEEYLPVLLGAVLPTYLGYNETLDPSVDNFFSTVAFRYGHAAVTDTVMRYDENGREHPQGHLLLSETWFQPDKALSAGIEPIIRGLVSSSVGAVEPRFSSVVQHNLFGPANMNGSDLFAINIQRGRDHGTPDYNTCRRLFGLKPIAYFQDISPDPQLTAALKRLYHNNIDNVDAYVGALAEPKYGNGHVGELMHNSIYNQFQRLRDGDWWYFGNQQNGLFTAAQIQEIKTTSFRDIILRNSGIRELPDDIWHVAEGVPLGTCDLSASPGGSCSSAANSPTRLYNATQRGVVSLIVLDGRVKLVISEAADSGWLRVRMTGAFATGYLGFGVAKQGQAIGQKMVDADLVIASMVDGLPSVQSYHAIGHQPPLLDKDVSGRNHLRLIQFQRANGQTVLEFERPYAASDPDTDQPVLAAGPNSFLVAHGLDDALAYHGVDSRAAVELPGPLFAKFVKIQDVSSVDATAVQRRVHHGALMAVNFILMFPLGALMARQLRAGWLKRPGIKAVLFYLHIGTQVCGVCIATAGFVIALKTFGIPHKAVMLHHGTLGVAVLVLVYSQLLVGFIRPPAAAATAVLRSAWQAVHALLGRIGLLLGMVNVFIGIYIFSTLYQGNIAVWGGWCAAGLGVVAMLQYGLDLLERRAFEALAAQLSCLPSAYKSQPPPVSSQIKGKRAATAAAAAATPLVPSGASQDLTGAFSGCFSVVELPDETDQQEVKIQRGPRWLGDRSQEPNKAVDWTAKHQIETSTAAAAEHTPAAAGAAAEEGHTATAAAAAAVAAPQHARDIGSNVTDHKQPAQVYPFWKALSGKHRLFSSRKPLAPAPIKEQDWAGSKSSATTTTTAAAAAAASAANSSVFCDYESAGVYDPNSGDFQAAVASKKPAVQEYKLPSAGLSFDLGLAASGLKSSGSGYSPGKLSRRHSADSNRSSGSNRSWRAAAAAAAAAAAGSGTIGSLGSPTAPGSQIAAMMAESKVVGRQSSDSWDSRSTNHTAASHAKNNNSVLKADVGPASPVPKKSVSPAIAGSAAVGRSVAMVGTSSGSSSGSGSTVRLGRSVTSGAAAGPAGLRLSEGLLALHNRPAVHRQQQQHWSQRPVVEECREDELNDC